MGGTRRHPLGRGPVFVSEWIVSSRRWQGYAQRSLFVVMLLAALVVVWSGRGGRGIVPSLRGLAEVGRIFSLAVVGTQLALVLLAAPAATAGALCLDRARGTLAHVLVTDLSDGEIVLGKLAARLLPVLALLVCGFPVMTLLMLLGGVDGDELLGAFLVTAGVAVLGCSLALAFSLWVRKTHQALLGTYAVWGLWLLVPWLLSFLGRNLAIVHWVPPREADPFQLVFAAEFAPGSVDLADYLSFLGGACAISAGVVALTVWRLRAVCAREPAGRGSSRVEKSRDRKGWRHGVRILASPLPGPTLDFNPVLWQEWHRSSPSRWGRRVVLGFVLLVMVSQVVAIGLSKFGVFMVIDSFLVSIGLLLLCVRASTSLAEERTRGSLDVLLATPMSSRQIVVGKWLGTFRLVFPLALLLALSVLIGPGWAVAKLPVTILMTGYVIATGAAFTLLGLVLAIWCARPGRAVFLAIAAYVTLSIGWMFLVMSLTSPHPLGFPLIAGSPFYGPMVILSLLEELSRGDLAAVVVWIGVYTGAAISLWIVALKTFDRRLGRVRSTPPGARRRKPEGARVLLDATRVGEG
ncbi:MAG: hypothetical protein NVSMB9_36260 [Isosphaeraceae bacterium]